MHNLDNSKTESASDFEKEKRMLAHFPRMSLRRIRNEDLRKDDERKSAKGNGVGPTGRRITMAMFSFEGVGTT